MTFLADSAANLIAVAHLAFFVFVLGGMAAIVLVQALFWIVPPQWRMKRRNAV